MKNVAPSRKPRAIVVKLAPSSAFCVALGCSKPTIKTCGYFCRKHCHCRAWVAPYEAPKAKPVGNARQLLERV